MESTTKARLSFAEYTLDLQPARLRREGVNVPLQSQPLRLLTLLASRAGEVVTHKEIRQHVWGDLQVDFASGMHVCIAQIRKGLEDDGVEPRFIETIPRRGYRFVASVSGLRSNEGAAPKTRRVAPVWRWAIILVAVGSVATLLWANLGQSLVVAQSSAPTQTASMNAPTRSAAPEQSYALGRKLLDTGARDDARQSRSHFARAIAADPDFAPAYAAMAKAFELDRDYASARQYAEQAIAIDPTYAEAQLRLAAVLANGDNDWRAAELRIQQAISVAPDLPDAHRLLATAYMVSGRTDQAIAAMEHALSLDPDSAPLLAEFGNLLYFAGQYAPAIQRCEEALTQDPMEYSAHLCLYKTHLILKELDRALVHALALMALGSASSDETAAVAKLPLRRGLANFESWRIDQLESRRSGSVVDPLLYAYSLAALRRYDDAFFYLLQAADQQYPNTALSTFDPIFLPIRHQSKYLEMLAQLGVVYTD